MKLVTGLLLGGVVVGGGLWAYHLAHTPTIPLAQAAEKVSPGYYDYVGSEGGWTFMYPDGHWEQVNNAGTHWTDHPGSHPVEGR